YANVDTNYATAPGGVVHLSSTDPDPNVVSPADFQFTAANQGVITFSGGVILFTPGTQTLLAVDTFSGLTDDGSATVAVTDSGGGAEAPGNCSLPRDRETVIGSQTTLIPLNSTTNRTAAFVDQVFANTTL